jgi:hypothetical protein
MLGSDFVLAHDRGASLTAESAAALVLDLSPVRQARSG